MHILLPNASRSREFRRGLKANRQVNDRVTDHHFGKLCLSSGPAVNQMEGGFYLNTRGGKEGGQAIIWGSPCLIVEQMIPQYSLWRVSYILSLWLVCLPFPFTACSHRSPSSRPTCTAHSMGWMWFLHRIWKSFVFFLTFLCCLCLYISSTGSFLLLLLIIIFL